jgi:hypothetical protein
MPVTTVIKKAAAAAMPIPIVVVQRRLQRWVRTA